jgi:hypothetical protein
MRASGSSAGARVWKGANGPRAADRSIRPIAAAIAGLDARIVARRDVANHVVDEPELQAIVDHHVALAVLRERRGPEAHRRCELLGLRTNRQRRRQREASSPTRKTRYPTAPTTILPGRGEIEVAMHPPGSCACARLVGQSRVARNAESFESSLEVRVILDTLPGGFL